MSFIKPSWKNAPAWAKWLAQDADGTWYWYEFRPEPSKSNPTWMRVQGAVLRATAATSTWNDTLERKP